LLCVSLISASPRCTVPTVVDRRFPVDANAATQPDCAGPCACMPDAMCRCADVRGPRRAAKSRKSASAESASRHGGSVRFDALPAWVLGSADRHRGSGARARAGGLARSPRAARRAVRTAYARTCAFLIQKSRSVKSQSSELPRPSKVDLHGSRASTRGSS
jgi:hypothetical protein